MRLNIGNFEIEIKAKHEFEEKFNKHTTLAFLNELAILYYEAGVYRKTLGMNATYFDEKNDEIYRYCEEKGLYKNL